jgi:membrane protease YdiL (CAAX protease family)
MPGAALFAFVVAAAALGIPAVVALLAGIALVIVPLELGYLLFQARRKTGGWSLSEVVGYRAPLPARRVALWAVPLVAWFTVILILSVGVLDQAIADAVFSWYPESVREFASFEEDATYATWVLVVFFAVAFAVNGVIGPVVEELYFRGHLLPRIDRLGRGAPVLNAVLFSLYHLWTPWQNPGRILALLPWIYTVWRKRSLRLSMAVHISVNSIFLLLVVAAIR